MRELDFVPVPVKLDADCSAAIVAYTHDLRTGEGKGNLYYELNAMLRQRAPAEEEARQQKEDEAAAEPSPAAAASSSANDADAPAASDIVMGAVRQPVPTWASPRAAEDLAVEVGRSLARARMEPSSVVARGAEVPTEGLEVGIVQG